MHDILQIALHGVVQLPWWGYILVAAVLTQITILGVTIFLHRCQAHRSVELHAIPSHFFRFWLWLTTGMVTKQWASIHRKHHARSETAEDPHSPQTRGIWKVLFCGSELYRQEARNQETLDRFGEGTPDDWIERNLYSKHSALGVFTMLGINLVLFGPIGLTIWAVQMAWIPFWAAGVINGVAHYVGYRNFECEDASRNISPIAFFIGGEELHNNHHTYGTSAKFSVKWWEFDIGWGVIRLLQLMGLAKPKRIPPKEYLAHEKAAVDTDTVKAIITNRFQVLSRYSKEVVRPVLRQESHRAGEAGRAILRRVRSLLSRETSLIKSSDQQRFLSDALGQFRSLDVVYQFRLKLQGIWAKSTASQKELVDALQEWCHQAEASGIEALRQFVKRVKAYTLQRA